MIMISFLQVALLVFLYVRYARYFYNQQQHDKPSR